MANNIRDPRAYELMAVLIPDMAEEDTAAAIERIKGYITSAGGEVTNTSTDSPWGRRRLAYTMRFNSVDYRDGYYVLTHFSATPNVITEIERELKLDVQVIRYLLVMDDPRVGEKDTGQHDEQEEAPAASGDDQPTAPAASTEETPAEQGEAQETASTEVTGSGETGEAEEAPAVEQEAEAAPAEEQTAEVAGKIEGEENPAPADAPAATRRTSSTKLPDEGEGTDWIAGDGTNNLPEGFTLKGNASSKIYHPEESPSYNNTTAEIYFATPEAAERFGYRLPKTLQHAAGAELGKSAPDTASEEE